MKKSIILLCLSLLVMVGCKTKETVITKNHLLSDTTIHHRVETVELGANIVTIVPCKEINQVVDLGNTKVVMKSIDSTNSLEVTISKPETVQVIDSTKTDHIEINETTTKETIIKFRTPKWAWITIIILSSLTIWNYRKLIIPLLPF